MASTAKSDWETSLKRQIQLYYWLQTAEGGVCGCVTNSVGGRYLPYPQGVPTFYNLVFRVNGVYLDPPGKSKIFEKKIFLLT